MFSRLIKREKGEGGLKMIPLDDIAVNPAQPRRFFDDGALGELAASIREHGVIQPLAVRPAEAGGGYELISGERRLRAARMAGLEAVPAVVMEADGKKSRLLALVENIQREDLSFFETAEGIDRLMKTCGLSQREAARELSLSQPAVANKLRLLRLTAEERRIISEFALTERHARALLRIAEPALRLETLRAVARRGLNVRQTEEHIERMLAAGGEKSRRRVVLCRDVRIFANTVSHAVEVMREAGVRASLTRSDGEGYIEYLIRIPNTGGAGSAADVSRETAAAKNR